MSATTGRIEETVALEGMKESDVVLAFRDITVSKPIVFMEKVGFIRGDGGKGAFTFGQVYGFLRGLALANGMDIADVYPMIWQTRLNCLTRGNKNVSKNKAIELFPDYHRRRQRGITHGIADAILIAEYGRRIGARQWGG